MMLVTHLFLSDGWMIRPSEYSEVRCQRMTACARDDNSLPADSLATGTGRVLPDPACFKLTAVAFSARRHPSSPHVNLNLHNS